MDEKYTCQIQHRLGDPNEVVRDNDDTEDDSDAAEPIKNDGIGSVLDHLHQDIHSNVPMSTSAFEDSSYHEHNINKVEGTYE